MSYLVMETKLSYCVVLDSGGRFIKAANFGYNEGDIIEEIYPMETTDDIAETVDTKEKKKNNLIPLFSSLAAIAAVFVFAFYNFADLGTKIYGDVYISVNPEVRMGLNKSQQVVELEGINPDGQTLIEGYSFKKKPATEVANHIVEKADSLDYIDGDSVISFSVDSADEQWFSEVGLSLRENVSYSLKDGTNVKIAIDKYDTSNVGDQRELPDETESSVIEVPEPSVAEPPESSKTEQPKPESTTKQTAPSKTEESSIASKQPESSRETSSKEEVAKEITLARAKEIAMRNAGVASGSAVFTKEETDHDDGKKLYELEFKDSKGEYEYDIDAETGAILKHKIEKKETSTQVAITKDKALAIALDHAGISASQAEDIDVDYDDDDNEYEVDFEVGDNDYEYKIDGATGRIKEYKAD